MNDLIRKAILLLVDEGFRVAENNKYVDWDGEEDGKTVWVVENPNEGPARQKDFFTLEEAVDHFMKVCGYED
jgi:hypothetical protein